MPRALALAVALAGCAQAPLQGDVDGGTGMLSSLSVAPASAEIALGTTVKLTATGVYLDGSKRDLTMIVKWSSSNASVATVESGVVSGAGAGSSTITAQVGGATASAQVSVVDKHVVSITVDPPVARLDVGGTATFTATASFADGSHQDISDVATWVSGDATVATVAKGVVTGVAPGSTTIAASFGGASGSATLMVTIKVLQSITLTPKDLSIGSGVGFQFIATGEYSDGSERDLTNLCAWMSSAPSVVQIQPGGFASTLSSGVAIITAQFGNVSASTTVTVNAVQLASLEIQAPDGYLVPPNGISQLKAIGTFMDGTKADVTAGATWSSDAPQVAAVSNANGTAGLISGLVPGLANVGQTSGVAQVTVTKAKLGGIDIIPADWSVPLGLAFSYEAVGFYNDGSSINLTRDVTWASTDVKVVAVSNAFGSSGAATTVGTGQATVSATFAGVTKNSSLTVGPPALKSIDVAPPNASLVVGAKQSMTATARYTDGSTMDITQSCDWMTLDNTIATITNAGQLSCIAVGATNISASYMNVQGTTSVACLSH